MIGLSDGSHRRSSNIILISVKGSGVGCEIGCGVGYRIGSPPPLRLGTCSQSFLYLSIVPIRNALSKNKQIIILLMYGNS